MAMIRPNSVSSADAGSRETISVMHRPAGGKRIAEIAVGEVIDITRELLGQWLVEAERFAHLGDRLRRRRGAGEIDRRIAGQHARQQERDDDDADQRRNHGHERLKDIVSIRLFRRR